MLISDIEQACKEKGNFEFSYTKPSLDWYDNVKVSIAYDDYNALTLQRRYGPSWYLIGHKYDKERDKWSEVQIGQIYDKDIPRLIAWAEYTNENNQTMSILTEVNAIDGCLNPIGELFKIMSKHRIGEKKHE